MLSNKIFTFLVFSMFLNSVIAKADAVFDNLNSFGKLHHYKSIELQISSDSCYSKNNSIDRKIFKIIRKNRRLKKIGGYSKYHFALDSIKQKIKRVRRSAKYWGNIKFKRRYAPAFGEVSCTQVCSGDLTLTKESFKIN